MKSGTKVYIFGDVHNYVKTVRRFLENYKPKKVIWLGDWFDSWHDGPKDARKTAKFLADLIDSRPDDIFILGNHDISYMFPVSGDFRGYGWTEDKQKAVDEHMKDRHWRKFVIVHKEEFGGNSVLFSHAGFRSEYPVQDMDMFENLRLQCEHGLESARKGRTSFMTHADNGPLWVRDLGVWNSFYQVFGHTPVKKPEVTLGLYTANVNFDCAHTYFGAIDKSGIYKGKHDNGKLYKIVDFSAGI